MIDTKMIADISSDNRCWCNKLGFQPGFTQTEMPCERGQQI